MTHIECLLLHAATRKSKRAWLNTLSALALVILVLTTSSTRCDTPPSDANKTAAQTPTLAAPATPLPSTEAARTTPVTPAAPTTTTPSSSSSVSGCNLLTASKHENDLLKQIKPLIGQKFKTNDSDHTYFLTVCGQAEHSSSPDVGLMQINEKQGKTFIIGRLDDVDLEAVEDKQSNLRILRMVYKNGENYGNACARTQRNAVIYIACNSGSNQTRFRIIEENNGRNESCAYVFKLMTPLMCNIDLQSEGEGISDGEEDSNNKSPVPTAEALVSTSTETNPGLNPGSDRISNANNTNATQPTPSPSASSSKLGFFSILLIVVFSLLSVYLLVGSIYLRLVRNARGWEQLPNRALWQTIGNRSADCCNYICRCGQRQSEVHSYDHIADHVSDDENLLNF